MKVIGITGGMASGKSTVARMFAGRGIRHVDADKLVHHLMSEDKETIALLAAVFPEAAETKETLSINRKELAAIAARDSNVLQVLEEMLHPRVRALEVEAIARARREHAKALILDIPLLFETDADDICDVVIAVHAPMSHRRRRAFARSGMTEAKWERLLSRQFPARDRNILADMVIHTGVGKAETRRKVNQLMRQWGLK